MPSTKDFKPLWPAKEYPAPMPENAGDFAATRGGFDVGGNSDKETTDSFGQKVTTIDIGTVKKGDKVTPEKFGGEIATTTARKPTKSMKG